jgi:triacylglycerol esterase/lipase EstA (alpha/beta hydrolase family)
MLARAQQALTLGALLLAALWAWLAWRAGHPAAAAVGAAAVLLGHAAVLALEMVFMMATRRDDPSPRPTLPELLRAWAGEVVWAPLVFCWRQPFRSRAWPDVLDAGLHRGRRGVVLVHGFVCNRGLWNPWLRKLTANGTPFVAVDLEPVLGSIDGYADIVESAVRRVEAATGLAPVMVAHSMGGLALRRWYSHHGGAERVHHVITIASPHRGTWLARFAFTRNTRQMRQLSGWLGGLSSRESALAPGRWTCFYGHCDNVVFPPATATLPGADNRHLRAVAHVHMADRPEPWAALEDALRR